MREYWFYDDNSMETIFFIKKYVFHIPRMHILLFILLTAKKQTKKKHNTIWWNFYHLTY